MFKESLLVLATIFVVHVASVDVKNCKNVRSIGERKDVSITGCETAPCTLRKNKNVKITETFVPEIDIQTLKNKVSAKISGIPFPFLGVDDTDACENIYDLNNIKVGCPLTAGREYIYRNNFDIQPFYPSVSCRVHWSLESKGKSVACFEVEAKIR